MLIIYNILQLLSLVLFGPIALLWGVVNPKYGGRLFARLGLVSTKHLGNPDQRHPVIWVHGLSVGEVKSAKSLLAALRRNYPGGLIFLSVTTRSGEQEAGGCAPYVDAVFPLPFDIIFVVQRTLRFIRPDVFVLVETDFWPNLLWAVAKNGIPAILVNGRMSHASFRRYKRLLWFVKKLFRSFAALAVQRREDVAKFAELGVDPQKIHILGNLKYDTALGEQGITGSDFAAGWRRQKKMLVAGSTHPEEEAILLKGFGELRRAFPDLLLVLAPRDIRRGGELVRLANRFGFDAWLRSEAPQNPHGPVMILDTLGELQHLYQQCEIAFVGGSLVAEGGHNPLEAVGHGKPVLVGPHYEDFLDIYTALLNNGCALRITAGSFAQRAQALLEDSPTRAVIREKAREFMASQDGVTQRHVALIESILAVSNRKRSRQDRKEHAAD